MLSEKNAISEPETKAERHKATRAKENATMLPNVGTLKDIRLQSAPLALIKLKIHDKGSGSKTNLISYTIGISMENRLKIY